MIPRNTVQSLKPNRMSTRDPLLGNSLGTSYESFAQL